MDFFMPEGKRFGDFSLIEHEDRLYCVFIENIRTASALSGGVSVGNCLGLASSVDGLDWHYHGTILKPGDSPATAWKSRNLWAPDIFKHEQTFYLIYSGVSSSGDDVFKTQQVGISSSTDLKNWTEASNNPCITQADTAPHYYGTSHPRFCWRDPNVIQIGEVFYCTLSGRDSHKPYERSGCVALLRSSDLQSWEALESPFSPGYYFELETSTVYAMNDRYLLLFGHYTNGHCMSYAWSNSVEGPFKESLNNVLTPSFVYAGKIVRWQNEWLFYHWIRDPVIGKFETRLALPKRLVLVNDAMHLELLDQVRSGVMETDYNEWVQQVQTDCQSVCRCSGHLADGYLRLAVEHAQPGYSRRITLMPSHGGMLIADMSCSDSINDVRTVPVSIDNQGTIDLFKFGPICEVYLDSVFVHSFYLTGSSAEVQAFRTEGGVF